MKIALVIAVLAFFGFLVFSEYTGPGMVARKACVEYGEDLIKYPADADWEFAESSELNSSEWRVTGRILAPNAFGVRERLNFVCEVLLLDSKSSGFVHVFLVNGAPMDLISRSKAPRN